MQTTTKQMGFYIMIALIIFAIGTSTQAQEKEKSLYDRGGVYAIATVVDDFMNVFRMIY
jgi:hypothetical protein